MALAHAPADAADMVLAATFHRWDKQVAAFTSEFIVPDQNERSGISAPDEHARSSAPRRFGILDSAQKQEFDDIVALAAEVRRTPIAVVNFVDTERRFIKAEVGLGVRKTPLGILFRGTAILSMDMTIVPGHDAGSLLRLRSAGARPAFSILVLAPSTTTRSTRRGCWRARR